MLNKKDMMEEKAIARITVTDETSNGPIEEETVIETGTETAIVTEIEIETGRSAVGETMTEEVATGAARGAAHEIAQETEIAPETATDRETEALEEATGDPAQDRATGTEIDTVEDDLFLICTANCRRSVFVNPKHVFKTNLMTVLLILGLDRWITIS